MAQKPINIYSNIEYTSETIEELNMLNYMPRQI